MLAYRRSYYAKIIVTGKAIDFCAYLPASFTASPLHSDCREFRGGNRYFFAPKMSDNASMLGTASGFQHTSAVSESRT